MTKEKDGLKCKEWERRRRDRLNEAFKALAQLLPHHDPAKAQPKIDILEESTQFVKELRLSNSRLLTSHNQTQSKEMASKIRELQDEVNKLILRVRQLTKLLKEAKIPIPSGPSIKLLILKRKRRLQMQAQQGNKVLPEDLENAHRVKNPITTLLTPVVAVGKCSVPDTGNEAGITKVKGPAFPKTKIIVMDSGSGHEISGNGPLRETTINASADPPAVPVSAKEPTVPVTGAPEPLPALNPSNPVISLASLPTLPTLLLTQCQPQPLVFTLARPQVQMQPRILPKFTLVNSMFQMSSKVPIMPVRRAVPFPVKPKFTRRSRQKQLAKVKLLTSTTSQTQTETQSLSEIAKSESEIEIVTLSPGVADSIKENAQPEPETANIDRADENDHKIDSGANNMDVDSPIPPVIDISEDAPAPVEPVGEPEVQGPAIPEENSELTVCSAESKTIEIDSVVSVKNPESNSVIANEVVADMEIEEDLPEIPTEAKSEKLRNELESELPAPESQAEAMQEQESSAPTQVIPEILNSIPEIQLSSANNQEIASASLNEITADITEAPLVSTVTVTAEVNVTPTPEPVAVTTLPETPVLSIPPSPVKEPNNGSLLEEACLSSDKISECIARSIDLIEHPENELMELSGDWGTHSPKSPISPTQMFLSMFPLLPRESIVTVAAETQNQHKNSSRSSFYIDSMLPDSEDQSSQSHNSTSIHNLEPENHFRTLTTVSSSSTTCLAMTPLTPVLTCTKKISSNDTSLESFTKVLAPLQNYKEKRASEAVYVALNEPSSTRSISKTVTRNTTNPKSSVTKKFLTVLEAVNTANTSGHDYQQPNFFPYTPMTSIEAQSQTNPISQFFNSFTGSNTGQYSQPAGPTQTPCSTAAASNRQMDFDFSFRQNHYPNPNQEFRVVNPHQHHIQCDTSQIRQASTSASISVNTGPKVTSNFSEAQIVTQKSVSHKSQAELFRPAPNVFMSPNAGTTSSSTNSKQQQHKVPRVETQAYNRSNVQRVCHTKTSVQQQQPPLPPPPAITGTTGEYARHQQHGTSTTRYAPEAPYPASVQPQVGQKQQVPNFQPQSRNRLPVPSTSQIPVFPATIATSAAVHKPPGTGSTMDFTVDQNPAPSRTNIPPSIPAPDFSYSNQNYHTSDTHYFHDPNNRPFYQAYPNAPVTVSNKPAPVPRTHPYYLPEPSPVQVPASYETFHASQVPQGSSIPQPSTNTQAQSQGHFPQNTNFFPPFYNNPVHVHNPSKECSGHQSHAYNPVPPKSSTGAQEYFQYQSNNNTITATGNDAGTDTGNAQQHPHHRPAPAPPTAASTTNPTPSPKKTPSSTMNFGPGSQQPSNPATMKRSNNSTGHQPQQRPVNWMTDNSTYKKGSTVVSNPFSVSKLVGSGTGTQSNYCAEALIRKNNSNSNWNDFQFPNSNSNPNSENSTQFQGTPQPQQTFLSQTQQSGGHYSSFPHQHQHHQHHQYNPYSRNFNQFNTTQHQHNNSGGTSSNLVHQAAPSSGSSVNVNTQGTTSSISNFNLSSIFPEINDKGSKSATGGNASNNCNYYANRK